MKFYNSKLCNLTNRLKGKRVVVFGVGEFYKYYFKENFPKDLVDNVIYAIDNNVCCSHIELCEKEIPLYKPTKLYEEKECVIMLASGNFMYEMYHQLEDMNLGDGISCYSFPLIMSNSIGKTDEELKKIIFNEKTERRIEKVIHSFWFSGDKKPEVYQKCVDSWKRKCPDYKIIEWNTSNYDYNKNRFMKQAIMQKKWAFASDYARLDVLYRFGGIYLDMDVEVLKSLDCLLGNRAFFTFDTMNNIDLGTVGAEPQNELIGELLHLYDNVDFSKDAKVMEYFCQPRYIRTVLEKHGLTLNGDMQEINGMVFLPRNFLAPKDSVIYELGALSYESLGIHHFNAGWRDGDYRMKRVVNNRGLWNLIEKSDEK